LAIRAFAFFSRRLRRLTESVFLHARLAFLGQFIEGAHAAGAYIEGAHLAINMDPAMMDV